MPPFSLAPEPTRATVSNHFPNVGPLVLRFFPRQYPLWVQEGSRGTVRQSSAMAAGEYESLGGGKGSIISPERVQTKRLQKFWNFEGSREGAVRDSYVPTHHRALNAG